jgi:hypothetical protein
MQSSKITKIEMIGKIDKLLKRKIFSILEMILLWITMSLTRIIRKSNRKKRRNNKKKLLRSKKSWIQRKN